MKTLSPRVTILSSVDSTNNYVAKAIDAGEYEEGTAIMAHFQTAGRGQRGSSWQSATGENLTFSFGLRVENLPVHQQFTLSKAVALALYEAVEEMIGSAPSIKWPNDLLLEGKKLGGVLIEFKSVPEKYAVIGVGLNVNQMDFDEAFKATSLARELGHKLGIEVCLQSILRHLNVWISKLDQQGYEEIQSSFKSRLYGMGEWITFEEKRRKFQGMIADVDGRGMLMVKSRQGYINQYAPKDVSIIY